MRTTKFERIINFKIFLIIIGVLIVINFLLQNDDIKILDVNYDSNCRVSFTAMNRTNEYLSVEMLLILNDSMLLKPGVEKTYIIGQKEIIGNFNPQDSKKFDETVDCFGTPKSVDVIIKNIVKLN